MKPSENDDVPEVEFRYKMLVQQLESSQISDVEATHLHLWLSDQVSERLQNQVISTAIGQESLSEQIKICTMLLEGASAIAEQFTYLNQISPVDIALSQAFQSNQQEVTTSSDSSSPAPRTAVNQRAKLTRQPGISALNFDHPG